MSVFTLCLPLINMGGIIPALPLYLWGLLGMVGLFLIKGKPARCFYMEGISDYFGRWFSGWEQAKMHKMLFCRNPDGQTGQWINENLPSDVILAAHDIGAVRLFLSNPLVDLAGLITPEVVFLFVMTRLSSISI
jgi:hypothetical protein